MPVLPTRGAVASLLGVLEAPGPIIILPHDNPDPDALASAATIRYLAQLYLERDAQIALGGIVGRAENRAMLTYLNINLVPVSEVEFTRDTRVVLVDTQPGRPNNSLPEHVRPTAVIDHHPAYATYPEVPFLDLRDQYGATSTIVAEYLRDARADVDAKIATALFYGIAAETQDFGREATAADVEASHFLYPYTNKRRLGKIENARVPRAYFRVFRDAIDRATLHGNVVVSYLGAMQYPDTVAEVADFLLRLEEVDWAVALGTFDGYLYCSVRTTDRDMNAGDMLQKVLGSKSAGGHDMIAGGRVAIGGGPEVHERAAMRVRDRLLFALGQPVDTTESLVG